MLPWFGTAGGGGARLGGRVVKARCPRLSVTCVRLPQAAVIAGAARRVGAVKVPEVLERGIREQRVKRYSFTVQRACGKLPALPKDK